MDAESRRAGGRAPPRSSGRLPMAQTPNPTSFPPRLISTGPWDILNMKTTLLAIALAVLACIAIAGCQPARNAPANGNSPPKGLARAESTTDESPRAKIIQGTLIEVRYRLPDQEALKGESSAARWGLAAPVEAGLSDPNRIVYDQHYIEQYVEWAAITPIACGPGSYVIVTPQGERTVHSGSDEAYLGNRFSADHLVAFLKTRMAGKSVERTFRVDNAEAAMVLRDYPDSHAAKRLFESPWDRDARMIIGLLGLVPYEPAYPMLVTLAKDPNAGIQYEAIMALGRLAGAVPAAVDELEKLLGDKSASKPAAGAVAMAGSPGLP